MKHNTIREGDEFSCSCGMRWDTGEEDPHTETFGEPLKHCYNCDAEVKYLFDDGRCGDCTALTPEEVRGH